MATKQESAEKQLCLAAVVSCFFIVAQLIGGYFSGSVAILTDSAHLASDLIGFGISIGTLKMSQWEKNSQFTFGWQRAEVIGSVLSLSMIWLMTVILISEANDRLLKPSQVQADVMLPVSIMGLIFNLIQMKILKQQEHEEKSLNVSSAYLHVLGDMLMSCGVITAAVVIYFNPVLWWFDPLCTYLFAGMVLCTSYPTLKNCFIIMMEGSPNSSVVDEVTADLLKIKNVISVHDVHFWQTSQGRNYFTAHIKSRQPQQTLRQATALLREKFNLKYTTIQVD